MLDIYVFYAISALTVISALAIFFQKKLIYAVGAITCTFISSALLFILLGQTLIGLLLLIIFVGGLSTYLIVAVATEEKNTGLIKIPIFAVVAIIFFIGLTILLGYLPSSTQSSAPSFLSAALLAFQSGYLTLYLVVFLLFGVAISGTLIIKKFNRLVV